MRSTHVVVLQNGNEICRLPATRQNLDLAVRLVDDSHQPYLSDYVGMGSRTGHFLGRDYPAHSYIELNDGSVVNFTINFV